MYINSHRAHDGPTVWVYKVLLLSRRQVKNINLRVERHHICYKDEDTNTCEQLHDAGLTMTLIRIQGVKYYINI